MQMHCERNALRTDGRTDLRTNHSCNEEGKTRASENPALASNRLCELADRLAVVETEAEEASRTAAEKWIEAGALLCEARSACRHGEWSPFLARAGIPERNARRYMQLARSGLKPDTVSDLGGLKAALDYLSERCLPREGEMLIAMVRPGVCCGFVWRDRPGFYQCTAIDLAEPGFPLSRTERPVSGKAILHGGRFVHPVWDSLDQLLGGRLVDAAFGTARDTVSTDSLLSAEAAARGEAGGEQ